VTLIEWLDQRNGFFLRDFDMQQKNQIPIRNLIFPFKKLEIYFYFKECISIFTFVRGEIIDSGDARSSETPVSRR